MARARTPRQEEEQTRRAARHALFPLMEELDPLIRSLARIHERIHGGQVAHAKIRLVDDQGKARVYPLLTGETQDNGSPGKATGLRPHVLTRRIQGDMPLAGDLHPIERAAAQA